MDIKISKTYLIEYRDIEITLQRLSIAEGRLTLLAEIPYKQHEPVPNLSLILQSGPSLWTYLCDFDDGTFIVRGDVAVKKLVHDISFKLCFDDMEYDWLDLQLDQSLFEDCTLWSNYFLGPLTSPPQYNLGRIAKRILEFAEIIYAPSPSSNFSDFCQSALGPDFVIRLARLRRHGLFPAITAKEDGVVLASKLVLLWNVLLIQDSQQRLLVFQGVTSCDAVFIPGLNKLIIVCHISHKQILDCLRQLCKNPEFFLIDKPRTFIGYLVGHSRPYHCNYDSLLALQRIWEEGEILPEDGLFSKSDEAFIDLGAALDLPQQHQCRNKDELNDLTEFQQGYLLKLGSCFSQGSIKPNTRYFELASNVDASLRQFASVSSNVGTSGAMNFLEECQPLIWVGVTGQKRSWVDQVIGTQKILNNLYKLYPHLGVIFDGWTPPLVSSDYHRTEARKDNQIIRQIIEGLEFREHGRFGIIAGLPMLEKIRVGMSIDCFIANYTTGSINVARICKKPGVGHMSRKMVATKCQHIHHSTSEIDPLLVQDQGNPGSLPGLVDYNLPWQAIYNVLLDILSELPIKSTAPLKALFIPRPQKLGPGLREAFRNSIFQYFVEHSLSTTFIGQLVDLTFSHLNLENGKFVVPDLTSSDPSMCLIHYSADQYIHDCPDILEAMKSGIIISEMDHFLRSGYIEIIQGRRHSSIRLSNHVQQLGPGLYEALQFGIKDFYAEKFVSSTLINTLVDLVFINLDLKTGKIIVPDLTSEKPSMNLIHYSSSQYRFDCPDIQEAINSGIVISAIDHFLRFGYIEIMQGRRKSSIDLAFEI